MRGDIQKANAVRTPTERYQRFPRRATNPSAVNSLRTAFPVRPPGWLRKQSSCPSRSSNRPSGCRRIDRRIVLQKMGDAAACVSLPGTVSCSQIFSMPDCAELKAISRPSPKPPAPLLSRRRLASDLLGVSLSLSHGRNRMGRRKYFPPFRHSRNAIVSSEAQEAVISFAEPAAQPLK